VQLEGGRRQLDLEALDLLADAIAARIESLPKIDTASEGSDGQPSD